MNWENLRLINNQCSRWEDCETKIGKKSGMNREHFRLINNQYSQWGGWRDQKWEKNKNELGNIWEQLDSIGIILGALCFSKDF